MSDTRFTEKSYDNLSIGILYLIYRLLEIFTIIAFHSFHLGLSLIRQKVLRHYTPRSSVFGNSLAALLESLGTTFIKIGQILSSRPDLLPANLIAPLSRLQDGVAPFNHRKIPHLIQQAFGRSIEELFESFDFTPVSSASVAQVHRARLKGGEDVAIKIRRPGLLRIVKSDLLILRLVLKIVEWFPALRLVPIRGIAEEFGQVIKEQLDFRLEADNNRRFRKNLCDVKQVIIPKLYDDLCTESILTMEYLDGLIKIDKLDFNIQQREQAAAIGLKALYRMMFVDGLIHADMHPGNIFFRKGVEFILLDFGLVAKLDDRDLKNFARFFFGMASNNGKLCAQIVHETATFQAVDYDQTKFESAMVDLIAKHSSKVARDFEVTEFAVELFDTQRKHRIRGSTRFTMAIISLVVFEGIAKQIYPDLDFQREARQFIPSILKNLILN